ncbi:amidophosphoribosyltransferase precursor [Oxobacter pfennigii]|uniref:Amidophosphoribosyltransferase n=1 Tax=Oxobacter pfennigii TaxID=36849 RepID=A0A0P8WBC4_9CLOT|nr:amidophosphoribosyltransferase [Oxobacter pfennigii]KPU45926.1 amidophosphoribosyltransferase precursor [Oxobacter pfennigii]
MVDILETDKFKDECGVFGIWCTDEDIDCAKITYLGLYALQHRGQESAGIAVYDGSSVVCHKEMGLVSDVFRGDVLDNLKGSAAIGHVRYSTTGASTVNNAQPLVMKYKMGNIALAHNGNLVNAEVIRDLLEDGGAVFQTSIDSEVIANLFARYAKRSLETAVLETMQAVKGSYALTILADDKLIGVRDPYGIRPLCIGKIASGFILASESCAIDTVGGEFIRDVEPGEIIIIDNEGLRSLKIQEEIKSSLCIFEYIYFARPDSTIDGIGVYEARRNAGAILAQEYPVEADLVIGVPDSGTVSAIGYAEESGIPFGEGLIKNKYVGRTFIKPDQTLRELAVQIKLNALKRNVEGKRIVMVDDSIVRGTTCKKIVSMLRSAGAKEVHVRICSPLIKYPCYFGIDTPSRKQLIGAVSTMDEIRDIIGADSLGYISLDGLIKSTGSTNAGFCTGCFSGVYPISVPRESDKYLFEKGRLNA